MVQEDAHGTDLAPVLFLTYYFPPIGGPGVQRSLKFVRYLPDEGFRPVVVAGPDRGRDRWEPEDPSLLDELPADLLLYRPSVLAPGREAASTRMTRILGRPTRRFLWWRDQAEQTGMRAALANRVRLVLVTASPFEGIAAGVRIARRLEVPVVADLRDPWGLDETIIYPTRLHRLRDLKRMREALSSVDLIIMNTSAAEQAVDSAFPELAHKCTHVANGYDPADFEGLQAGKHDDFFCITHVGYLYTDIGLSHSRRSAFQRLLGGELVPVNLLARSLYFLLQALEQLVLQDPRLKQRLRLNLVGPVTSADESIIAKSPVKDVIRLQGQVSHRDAIRAMVDSDLLFFPMHGLPAGVPARIVPAKFYEYLGSGRPILAAVPEGDAMSIMHQTEAGRVVAPNDVSGMADAIRSFMHERPLSTSPGTRASSRFSRRVLTKALAHRLWHVLKAVPSHKGTFGQPGGPSNAD